MHVVVGAALVRDGRVLAAQRTRPPEAAGRWELPGGSVEAGESEAVALAREGREELGVALRVGRRLGPDVDLGAERVLRVHLCTTTGEPTAREHTALRWVRAEELADLDWLPADRVLLDDLARTLRGPEGPGLRPRGPS